MISEGRSLGQETARGAAWNLTSYGLSKGVVLVTTAVLARLLSPEDFGLVAIATVAITYVAIIQDAGLTGALIQRREDAERTANVVFTLNLALGAVLAVVTALIAPWVARFFGEPDATQLIRVLGLTFAIAPLGATHQAQLERDLAFQRRMVPDIATAVIKGIVAIPLAFAGYGAWALVIGQVAGVIAGAALSWVVLPWMPRLTVDRRLTRSLLGFGVPFAYNNGLHAVMSTIDYIIVGRVLGTMALGIYTVAFRIPELLVLSTVAAFNRVAFPAFASVQNDPAALRRGYLRSIRFLATLIVPICLGLAVAARPIVLVFFGDTWTDTIPLVRLLALYALVSVVTSTDGDAYKAMGIPGLLARLGTVRIALMIPALYVGTRWGLIGVAVAMLVVGVVMTIARVLVSSRVLGAGVGSILGELMPATVAGLAMSAAVVATLLVTASGALLVQLVCSVAVGAAAYTAVLLAIDRSTFVDGLALVGIPQPQWRRPRERS
jgi:O-antigen/teichoic acid export membrane protein